MPWSLDARIPVSLLADPAALAEALAAGKPAAVISAAPRDSKPDAAVAATFFEAGATVHPAACACCQGQSPAGLALDRLFQARARGACTWFDRVLVLDQGGAGAALAAALRNEALAMARYRLA